MNKHLALISSTGMVLLTLAGCATTPNENGANNNSVTNSTTTTSGAKVSNSSGSTNNTSTNTGNSGNKVQVSSSSTTTSKSNYASEIAWITNKSYSVSGSTPNATVQTAAGDTLAAWITTATQSQDGHNQLVFFFLNGKYLGTDTAKPSLEITNAKAVGNSIAVTYPVYKKNDSFANPTGTPVTITYTWNGSTLVPNKPYPKQFQSSTTSSSSAASNSQVTESSYSSPSEAANAVINVEDGLGQMHSSNPPLNLGFGIKADQNGSLGTYTINWTDGNWTMIVTGPSSSPETQVAKQVVTYLHTHKLPAPQKKGAIFIHQPGSSSNAAADWHSTIAWQEGNNVYQLKQDGKPLHALQIVLNS